MAFTKIQPQQLQLPTFLSNSGDITFTDNVTGVDANISRSLDGDFEINGTLTISSNEVITTSNSNTTSSSNIILGGTNNSITGTNNVLLNGTANTSFSGNYNVLINGSLNDFGASGQNNTILAGRQCSFDDQITGSVILADHKTIETNDKNHSLLVSFDSGIEFKSVNSGVVFSDDAIFNDLVEFNDTVNLNSSLNVGDVATFSGSTTIENSLDVTGNSTVGNLNATGNLGVTGTAEFGGTVDIDNTLTLQDNSEAASQTWVNETGVRLKISHESHAALPTYLNTAYSNSFGTNSSNILNSGQPVTGFLLVDTVANPDEAKLVFVTDSFTGALDFTQFQYIS